MSQKVISQGQNTILEESFESSEELDDVSSGSIQPQKKQNEKLMIASLDLIDKKKRESFVQNLRLSVKDPMLDISNKEIITETRSKIEMLKINRKEFEFQIEQKLAILDNYENEIFKILQQIEKTHERPEMMETSIKMNIENNNSEKTETAAEILKKRREEYQKKKAEEKSKESVETKNKLNELKKKFKKTDENSNKTPINENIHQENKRESSSSKFDNLQKELEKKLNILNQAKKEETKPQTPDEQNTNKISLNDYRAQLKQKFAPVSETNIPMSMSSSVNKNEGKKVNSKIADRVANLENLFQGKTPGANPYIKSKIEINETPSVVMDHLTYERAELPKKINKKSKTTCLKKSVSKEWW